MADLVAGAVTELDRGGKTKQRRFDKRDWAYVADFVIDEFQRRKTARTDREKIWREIDRQIAMEPSVLYKMLPSGQPDTGKRWMSEMELPLQAQALEVLTADARKMMFPDDGMYFEAHAQLSDEYLRKVDFQSLVLGDEMEVPSKINQDNADKLVESFLLYQFRQYDFMGHIDRCNAEAFKYGMGIGRARMEWRNVVVDEAMGSFKSVKRIPVLHPCSVKNVYLDDPKPSMHSAQMATPAHIAVEYMRLENLQIAANKGSRDPFDADGGWMPYAAADLVGDENGFVKLIEIEGDIVVPRKSVRSFVLHNAVVTVAVGGQSSNQTTRGVVRFRWRKDPFSSYVLFPYHYEGAHDTYPTGPLMKGMPIQMMCSDALNRLMDSAALKNAPPIGYSPDNIHFAASGGPRIFPNAQWQTVEPVEVYNTVGGDPAALAQTLQLGIHLYADVTGVLPARIGAQTVSHTTAFAKGAELQRGSTRTVDYCTSTGLGPMTRYLDMAYQMARNDMQPGDRVQYFIPAYGGFVDVKKAHLPEHALFQWFGAGGPQEEQTKMAMKMNSLQMGLKMDALAVQSGKPATVNIQSAIREVLREGGWTDLEQITNMQATTQVAPQQALPPPQPNPGVAPVAMQGLPGGPIPLQ